VIAINVYSYVSEINIYIHVEQCVQRGICLFARPCIFVRTSHITVHMLCRYIYTHTLHISTHILHVCATYMQQYRIVHMCAAS